MIILDCMWEFSLWCRAYLSPALFGAAGQLGSLSCVRAGNLQTFSKHFQGYDGGIMQNSLRLFAGRPAEEASQASQITVKTFLGPRLLT